MDETSTDAGVVAGLHQADEDRIFLGVASTKDLYCDLIARSEGAGMEPSSELRELIGRLYGVFETGDMAVASEVMSRDDRLLLAGTDPGEFGRGPSEVLRVMQASSEEIRASRMAVIPGDAEAYTEGNVGWIWDQPRFRLPDGSEIPVRLTAVCHREDGAWRIVQVHASLEPTRT